MGPNVRACAGTLIAYPTKIRASSTLHVLADTRPYDLTGLDAKIQEGLDDIERGDVFTEDEARAYLKSMRVKRMLQ